MILRGYIADHRFRDLTLALVIIDRRKPLPALKTTTGTPLGTTPAHEVKDKVCSICKQKKKLMVLKTCPESSCKVHTESNVCLPTREPIISKARQTKRRKEPTKEGRRNGRHPRTSENRSGRRAGGLQ